MQDAPLVYQWTEGLVLMKKQGLKVIYIAGYGRSGSTLLERMLGQIDGFVAVGELRHIWERSFGENQLCGCGKSFRGCRFWQDVVAEAFGANQDLQIEDIRSLMHIVDRTRYIPKMVSGLTVGRYYDNMQKYIAFLSNLYSAIKKNSKGSFIIDSSKDPSTVFLLSKISMIDVYIIHIVRDSRGVAFSWQKKKKRPEIIGKDVYMATYRPAETAWKWMTCNWIISLSKYFVSKYKVIRYEDLVESPSQTLTNILTFLGNRIDNIGFLSEQTLRLDKINHTISGNPLRFQQNSITIRHDLEWVKRMEVKDKRLATLISLPVLLKYRYPLFLSE